ncbi:hypothetical protein G6F24_015564 [Rhizopus arrhizus]|nr:hypothetical protein G6F24_015564 [Rhizopus arrhizus]
MATMAALDRRLCGLHAPASRPAAEPLRPVQHPADDAAGAGRHRADPAGLVRRGDAAWARRPGIGGDAAVLDRRGHAAGADQRHPSSPRLAGACRRRLDAGCTAGLCDLGDARPCRAVHRPRAGARQADEVPACGGMTSPPWPMRSRHWHPTLIPAPRCRHAQPCGALCASVPAAASATGPICRARYRSAAIA